MNEVYSGIFHSDIQQRPVYIKSFSLEVDYTDAWKNSSEFDESLDSLKDWLKEDVQYCLKLGLFAGPYKEQARQARLSISILENGNIRLEGKFAAVHSNVVVMLLRWIVNMHHTPKALHEHLGAIDKEAAFVQSRRVFTDLVRSVRLVSVEPCMLNDQPVIWEDWFSYFPMSWPLRPIWINGKQEPTVQDYLDDEQRLVMSITSGISIKIFLEVEWPFIAICDSGAFRDLGDTDDNGHDGEFEVWVREGGDNQELILDYCGIEYIGVIELLNIIANDQDGSIKIAYE